MLLARRLAISAASSHRKQSLVRSWRQRLGHSARMATSVEISALTPAGGSGKTDPPEPKVYSDRWELIWGAGLGRGERWDAAAASPALVDLIKSGKVDVKGSRVLVPGCGRGYDLPVFRAAGAAEVVGLELAPTAAREARTYLREAGDAGQEVEAEKDSGAGAEAETAGVEGMRVEEGNFFLWSDPRVGDGNWDVGFDYTFGCAMHPGDRQQWAQHWCRHVRSGGVLVTLVFPVNPEADPEAGPPYPVSPELYTQLLCPQGFEVTYQEPVPAELSHPSRVGREVMMVWRKK